MLIQMSVKVADEAHCSAANCMRLTIEHMNTRSMFYDNNLIKIMMMLRKCALRKSLFDSNGQVT
ncbi:hypothetical protein D3C75_1367870 [compost metagenome]